MRPSRGRQQALQRNATVLPLGDSRAVLIDVVACCSSVVIFPEAASITSMRVRAASCRSERVLAVRRQLIVGPQASADLAWAPSGERRFETSNESGRPIVTNTHFLAGIDQRVVLVTFRGSGDHALSSGRHIAHGHIHAAGAIR